MADNPKTTSDLLNDFINMISSEELKKIKDDPKNISNLVKTLRPFLLKEKQLEIKRKKIMLFFNIFYILLVTAIGLIINFVKDNSIVIRWWVVIVAIIISLIVCNIIFYKLK